MPRIISASDFAEYKAPDQYWVLPGFLPKPGLLIILGAPRAGKSYLAIQTSLAIAQGTRLFPGTEHHKPHSVLYFYFDKTGSLVFHERLKHLADNGVSLNCPLFTLHPEDKIPTANIADPDCYNFFNKAIAEANPDVVVFDVLREFHNADENDSTEMKIIGDYLSNLCHGRTIILVHHTKKLDYANSQGLEIKNIDAARGSNYIVGKADTTWLLNDGYLNIESNFAPNVRYKMFQQKTGLWMSA